MNEDDNAQWLSLSGAAKRLNIHPTTLRRWADNGDLPVMMTPGGHRRFALTDIDQFANERHGLRRVSGIEQMWADQALTTTRQEILAQQNAAWLQTIDAAARERSRLLGQQLMALMLQYLAEGAAEQLLTEARLIGLEYGRVCQQMSLSLTDTLQAALFFRDSLLESALQLPENANIRPEVTRRLLRRLNRLLNVVHLALAEVYDESYNHSLPGS